MSDIEIYVIDDGSMVISLLNDSSHYYHRQNYRLNRFEIIIDKEASIEILEKTLDEIRYNRHKSLLRIEGDK